MLRFLCFISIFCLVVTFTSGTSTDSNFQKRISSDSLKILTWNVQMLPSLGAIFSQDLNKMQNKRSEWIIEYLKNNDFDIVMLQESFDNDFINDVNEQLRTRYPFQVNPLRPKWYKLSNGLMILSKIPLSLVGSTTFRKSAQSDFMTSKGAVLLEAEFQDKKMYFINTHLQADYKNAPYPLIRKKQLSQIYTDLIEPKIINKNNIMIAGDLNVEEDINGNEYKGMISSLGCVDIVYQFFKKQTISFDHKNSWNSEYEKSCRLDYLLTNFSMKSLNIEFIKPKKQLENKEIDLADHYGISACLRFQ